MFNADPWRADDPKAIAISRLITEMIALDNLPISFVENVGFVRLLRHLAPRYTIPSRKHVSNRLVPDTCSAVQGEEEAGNGS